MLEVHPTIRHQLFANTSRPAFGANPPSITGTTARHNLATSFTRALSEPKPNATQQRTRHHARMNLRPNVLCIRSTMSNSQRTTDQVQRPAIDHSRFLFFLQRSDYQCAELPAHETGGAERIRTDDPLLAKQVLSQLSYSPIRRAAA